MVAAHERSAHPTHQPTSHPWLCFPACPQPRTDAPADLAYLRRYFQSSPPASAKPHNGSSSAESAPADTSPANGDADADANGAAAEGAPSYHALQQRCWKLPGWAHYRSRSLEMNLMGAGEQLSSFLYLLCGFCCDPLEHVCAAWG